MGNLRGFLGIRKKDIVPNARIREWRKGWTKELMMMVFSSSSTKIRGSMKGSVQVVAHWVARGRDRFIH